MDPKHITSQFLRHLLTLTEQKEQFLKGLEQAENEIAKSIKGAATSVVEAAEAITHSKPAKKAKGKKTRKVRKAKAGKSGGLKERILALLQDAGDQGLKVKEIADKLGVKAANISVWFSTTGKKLANKIEPGRYAIKGSKAVAAVAPVAKAAKKPAKAAKKTKPAKKKSGITPEGRAKLAASMKARWAARRVGKPAAKVAKKKFKLPKKV